MPSVFLSYSHTDQGLKDQLVKQLAILRRQGIIEAWHERRVGEGAESDKATGKHIKKDEIVLLLISPDFIASNYCYGAEMKVAMERHKANEAVVIPIILRTCDWSGTPFGVLAVSPGGQRPVSQWPDRDEALLRVASDVRKAAEGWQHSAPTSEDYLLSDSFWELGQALGFPIQFNLVLQHLRQDMRDDWYFDCLQYQDFFSAPNEGKKIIVSLLQEWNGVYCGARSFVRNIPKKGYGERYGLETDFFDRFIYQAICTFLIPYYDPLLSHRVLSYRYDPTPLDPKYLFKPKISRWFTFEGITLTFTKSKKYLVITDLSNFFENISRAKIISELERFIPDIRATGPEKLQIRNAIGTLDKLLEQWTFSGSHGLPQNRDASSFLSNVLLSSVDKEMEKRNYDYYRYVDDIRIIANSELHAKRALQDLIRQLRTVGLNINAGKTKILAPDTSSDTLAEDFPSQDSTTNAINYMWQSRSRRLVTRSVTYIFNILADSIKSGKTQSRQFRFAVNRIAQIVESGLFDVSDALSTTLLDALSRTLSDEAVSTDQYCRLIAILDKDGRCLPALEAFLLAEEGAIHDWQNYNIWLLLAIRKHRSDALVTVADRKLVEDMKSGEAAAILIWLRCTGETALIERSMQGFSPALPYQNARYLLISASILPESSLRSLYGLVPTGLRGTMQRAARHNNENGLPFAVREAPDLLSLVNEVSEYDL